MQGYRRVAVGLMSWRRKILLLDLEVVRGSRPCGGLGSDVKMIVRILGAQFLALPLDYNLSSWNTAHAPQVKTLFACFSTESQNLPRVTVHARRGPHDATVHNANDILTQLVSTILF